MKPTYEQLAAQLADRDAKIESLTGMTSRATARAMKLEMKLAAQQLENRRLREALRHHHETGLGRGRDKSHSLTQLIVSGYKAGPLYRITDEALSTPASTEALEARFKERIGEPVYAYMDRSGAYRPCEKKDADYTLYAPKEAR